MQGRVLIIAGSDSGGGAGSQADLKTVTALGGYAATAVTAITVQNTLGVTAVHPIPTEVVEAQAQAVLNDIGADALKTGMLGDAAMVRAVARVLDEAYGVPVVIDPVMAAKGGVALLPDSAVHIAGGRVVDLLVTPDGETVFEGERIDTRHTHGTGCTLASACATGLAQGLGLTQAVARAWDYVHQAILNAPGFGAGHGPLDHGWPLRQR